MNKKTIIFSIMILAFLIDSTLADYFDDQGNILGRFRTDYDSTTEGSSSNPLDIGSICLYPDANDPVPFIQVHPSQRCPTGPTIYPGGPFPYSNTSPSATSFFVISGNVEPLGTRQLVWRRQRVLM